MNLIWVQLFYNMLSSEYIDTVLQLQLTIWMQL